MNYIRDLKNNITRIAGSVCVRLAVSRGPYDSCLDSFRWRSEIVAKALMSLD